MLVIQGPTLNSLSRNSYPRQMTYSKTKAPMGLGKPSILDSCTPFSYIQRPWRSRMLHLPPCRLIPDLTWVSRMKGFYHSQMASLEGGRSVGNTHIKQAISYYAEAASLYPEDDEQYPCKQFCILFSRLCFFMFHKSKGFSTVR